MLKAQRLHFRFPILFQSKNPTFLDSYNFLNPSEHNVTLLVKKKVIFFILTDQTKYHDFSSFRALCCHLSGPSAVVSVGSVFCPSVTSFPGSDQACLLLICSESVRYSW